jgi:hypothetical protein
MHSASIKVGLLICLQERMRRLEALRLELDSRRRTVADLQGRCERVRANLGTTRARGEVDMEITLRKMQVRSAAAHGQHSTVRYNRRDSKYSTSVWIACQGWYTRIHAALSCHGGHVPCC